MYTLGKCYTVLLVDVDDAVGGNEGGAIVEVIRVDAGVVVEVRIGLDVLHGNEYSIKGDALSDEIGGSEVVERGGEHFFSFEAVFVVDEINIYHFRADVHCRFGEITENLVVVIGSVDEGKPMLTVSVSEDLTSRLNAGQMVREAARNIQGGGGGQPHFATAGGRNADGIQAAIDAVLAKI